MKYGLSGKSVTVNMATLAPSSSVTSSKAVTVTRMVSAVGIVSSKGRHVMIPEIGPNKKNRPHSQRGTHYFVPFEGSAILKADDRLCGSTLDMA